MRWDNIALSDQHGFLLGYTIFYQRAEPADINGTAAHQKGNNSTSTGPQQVNCSEGIGGFTEYELTGLDLFSNYNISVAGYTSKGLGVRTSYFMARTGPYGNYLISHSFRSVIFDHSFLIDTTFISVVRPA